MIYIKNSQAATLFAYLDPRQVPLLIAFFFCYTAGVKLGSSALLAW